MAGCHRVGLTLWLALGLALCVHAAAAADVPRLPPPAAIPLDPVAPVSWLPAGWYLRSDIGYRMPTVGSADAAPPFPDPTGNDFDGGLTISAGAGIKTGWLRSDFTVDYVAGTRYTDTVLATNETTAKVSGTTALFNGYFDLGTWYRLTPYAGSGAGAGLIGVSDLQGPISGSDNKQWKFVRAAMAGLGWSISHNTVVDVGYRYLNLGDLQSANDGAGGLTLKDVANHEVRVGLRWSFNDLPEYN